MAFSLNQPVASDRRPHWSESTPGKTGKAGWLSWSWTTFYREKVLTCARHNSIVTILLGTQPEGPCAHRDPEKQGMLSIQDFLSNGKDDNLFFQAEKWERLTAWWSALSIEVGQIKLL